MTTELGLAGLRVVVTRAADQSASLIESIEQAGGHPVAAPMLQIDDPPQGLGDLAEAVTALRPQDWLVVTSPNGARSIVRSDAKNPGCRLAAIGRGTMSALVLADWQTSLVPAVPSSEGMLDAFPDPVGDARVLLVQGDTARPTLAHGLRSSGWNVDIVVGYTNTCPVLAPDQARRAASADVVVFASPSAVDRFVATVGVMPVDAVCIGELTATAAREAGFATVVADEPSSAGLLASLRRFNS